MGMYQSLTFVRGIVVDAEMLDNIDVVWPDGFVSTMWEYIVECEDVDLALISIDDETKAIIGIAEDSGLETAFRQLQPGCVEIPKLKSPYQQLRKLGLPTSNIKTMAVIT